MNSKAEKIREYIIENGLNLTTISNNLVRQIAQALEIKPNTVKSTLQRMRSRQRYEEPEEPEPEEEPPPPPIAPTPTKHETPPPPTQQQPPPLRLGQFIVRPKPQKETYDIFCPNCGLTEIDHPMTVVEKPVIKQIEIEVIPKGYIRAPLGGEDWLRILSLKHTDGRGVEECPQCAKVLLAWFNKNKTKLEKAAGVKREGDLLDTILDLGTAFYKAWQISQQLQARPS